MKLIMKDGSKLGFDKFWLEGQTLMLQRSGFKGIAIAIEIGEKKFPFRQPITFEIPKSFKKSAGIASIISEGDEKDKFIVSFNL